MNSTHRSLKRIPRILRNAHHQTRFSIALVLFALLTSLSFLTTVAGSPSRNRATMHRTAKSRRQATPASKQRRGAQVAGTRRAEARRRAAALREAAARQAAIARQHRLDESMRNEVQSMIVRDNTIGEDPEVRRVAVNALGNHAGTVVVMDPKTGRVYSIVNQEWGLRRGFKPCSTIKLVTGLAALNEKVIDTSQLTNISDSHHIDLTHALAYSKNDYFQQVGGQVGFDKMISYARRLGLGEKTGINAPDEFQGQVPTARLGLAVNRIYSHGDDFKVTAVQLATLVSAMANGGKLLSPRVPRTPQEDAKFTPRVRRLVNIDLDSMASMVPGMVGSVNYGSGRRANNPAETVAGKTGTCIEQGMWVGLFASYAPLVDPRLAVVVIASGTDAHSHFPASVAGQIYRDLNSRFGTPTSLQFAGARDLSGLNIRSDPKVALNEEEVNGDDEESDEAIDVSAMSARSSAAVITRTTRNTSTSGTLFNAAPTASPASGARWTNQSVPANSKVRRVLLAIPKRKVENIKPLVVSNAAPKNRPQTLTRPRRVSDNPK